MTIYRPKTKVAALFTMSDDELYALSAEIGSWLAQHRRSLAPEQVTLVNVLYQACSDMLDSRTAAAQGQARNAEIYLDRVRSAL